MQDQFSFEATLLHVIFYVTADRKELGQLGQDEGHDESKVKPFPVNTRRAFLEVLLIKSKPVKRQCLSVTAFQCILLQTIVLLCHSDMNSEVRRKT